MSSSFPQNMAPGRPYYASYPPRASFVAYPAPMRLPQGLPVRLDNTAFTNRPPMGQSAQPGSQASEQAGGNSVWPLVAGGAALAGAVYLGYQWLSKPRAPETAETEEAIEHSSEEALAEGAAKSEAAVVAKEATTETSAVSSSVSSEGSKLAKAAEGAVGTIEQEVSEVVKKGVEKAPSMMSRISNALSHRAVLIPAGLAAAAAAEYAYPVVTPLARTYAPVVAEYAAKSPALAADMWQAARQSIGNAILNFRYSGATTCAVPAKETLQSLSQAVCKPGEEPLTYLAGQQASRLWNYGAASLSALGTGISGSFGSTAAKEGAEKLGQCSANALESGAKNVGQCGLDEAPSFFSQKLSEGGQYLSGLFGSALDGAKSLVGGAGSEVVPEIVSSGKSAASSLTCPVPENPLLCMGSSTLEQAAKLTSPVPNPLASMVTSAADFTGKTPSLADLTCSVPKNPLASMVTSAANFTGKAPSLADLTCPVPKNPLASMVTSAADFTSQAPTKTLGNLATSSPDLSSSWPSLAEQASGTLNGITSTTTPAADNAPSFFSGWFDWFKSTPKLPLEPTQVPQNASPLANVTELVTGSPKLPLEPASASQNTSLLSNVTDLFKSAEKQPTISISSAPVPTLSAKPPQSPWRNPLLDRLPTSPASSAPVPSVSAKPLQSPKRNPLADLFTSPANSTV